MKRGRMTTSSVELDANGVPLTGEELLARTKTVDFTSTAFPEVNAVKFKRPDYKKSSDIHI